jgi:hypothetical protein
MSLLHDELVEVYFIDLCGIHSWHASYKQPRAFRVKVSALAVLKMAMHAQSGGRVEVRPTKSFVVSFI